MTTRRTTIGASILTALLLFAGTGAAQTGALDGAAEAAGGLAGSYDVDGSGAYDVAADSTSDAHQQAKDRWMTTNEAYEKARDELRHDATTFEEPDMPDAELPLDAVNHVEAAHADRLEKAAQLETGLVDAKADVSAWGNVKAFFSGIASAIGDAADGVKDLLPNHDARAEADAVADQAFAAENELRGELDAIVRSDARTPDLDPRVSGEYAFEHASEATTDATGIVQLP